MNIISVVWQALVILYIWTNVTYSPWKRNKTIQLLQRASNFTAKRDFYSMFFGIKFNEWKLLQHFLKKNSASMHMTLCYANRFLISKYIKCSSQSIFFYNLTLTNRFKDVESLEYSANHYFWFRCEVLKETQNWGQWHKYVTIL